MPLYFDYGSNMASGRLADRGIPFRVLGRARLDGYRLALTRRSVRTGTGVADIVVDPGSSVWGVLYELDDDAVAELDRKEGLPWAYSRRPVEVHPNGSGAEAAFTYVVSRREDDEVAPSSEYLESILDGAREHRLPAGYVASLESLRRRWLGAPSGRQGRRP